MARHPPTNRTEFEDAFTGPFLLFGEDILNPWIVDLGNFLGSGEGSLLLGRDSSCDLVLADSKISRYHARLDFDGIYWTLTDLKSSNGTFSDRRLVPLRPRLVESGDAFRLGESLQLIFLDLERLFELAVEWMDEAHPASETSVVDVPYGARNRTTKRSMPSQLLREGDWTMRAMVSFVEETKELGRERFLARFPQPALVLLTVPFDGAFDALADTQSRRDVTTATNLGQVSFWFLEPPKEDDGLLIGRGPANHIVLSYASVSRTHAWLNVDNGTWFFDDLGSTNGCHVNGYRVCEEVALSDEMLIRVGGECLLQFMKAETLWQFTQLFSECSFGSES